MSGVFTSDDYRRWARVSKRAAKKAKEEGRFEEAAGHLAEARSWLRGQPKADPRVPRG